MDRKKILFFVEAMGGGVFTYVVDLANELVNTYDMYIAYGIRIQTPINYKEYFDTKIHLIKVKNFDRSINPVKDISAFFEIKKIMNNIRPDIIHLHSSKAGVLGRLAFNNYKVPLFYTPHGYSFLMENYSPIKRSMYNMVEMVCGKMHCITISCSEGEYRQSLKLSKHAAYVSNGINVKELQHVIERTKIDKDYPFTVFTLGRICDQKNPKLFNEIALKMPNIKFLWIGDGELRYELTAPNIEITGWVDRKTALMHSMQANVFLLTSLWEGLPMSLLEAMYMKKLCVVNDVIGNNDVIHNGENGFVCKSVDEFVVSINNANKSSVSNLINKAYLNVIETYNTANMAKQYSDIYMKAIYKDI